MFHSLDSPIKLKCRELTAHTGGKLRCVEGKVAVQFVFNRSDRSPDGGIIVAGAGLRYLGNILRIESKAIYSVRALFESRTSELYAQLAIPPLCRLNFNHRSADFLKILDMELMSRGLVRFWRLPGPNHDSTRAASVGYIQSYFGSGEVSECGQWSCSF